MQTLSVVFFVATAIVFAASQSVANEIFDVSSFGAIQEKIEDVVELLKCGRTIVDDAIGDSELKADYEQFAHQVDQIIKNELPLCRVAGGKEVYKCFLVNGKKLAHYFYEFIKKVSEENKVIAEKIHNNFQQKCMKQHFFFMNTDAFNLGEQFQCIVDAIGDASKANGLTDVWSKAQSILKSHVDAWKQCDSAVSKAKVVFCNIKEGAYSYALVFSYIATISKNPNFPKFAQDFNKIAQQKCASHAFFIDSDDDSLESLLATEEQTEALETDPTEPTETETPTKAPTKHTTEPPTSAPTKTPTEPPTSTTVSPPVHGVWARLKCTIKSISTAVKDTDFAKVWDDYMTEFRAIESRIKVCKTKGIWQRTKCKFNEYRNASRNLRNFLRQFKKARRASYKRMVKYVWKRCV